MTALKSVADKSPAYDRLLDLPKDAETGQRGDIVTGDGAFHAPQDNAILEFPDALRALVPQAESPAERAAPGEIERLSRLKLDELAATDELTGLYNRRWLDETLRRELFRAERALYTTWHGGRNRVCMAA